MNIKNTQLFNSRGFTLIEILAVMVIIMIIAGLFVGVSGPASQSAKKRKAEVMISALEVAIGMYKADTGAYPPNTGNTWIIDDLKDNSTSVVGWGGPYMEFKREDYQGKNPASKIIVDPWGQPYNYDPKTITPPHDPPHNTNSFDLWSDGPDTRNGMGDTTTPDGKDDITNW